MPGLKISEIAVGKLKPFPGNARRGDVDSVAESLVENEQYKPIVVQKSTMFVLAGNHTLQAAKKLKWKTIDVVIIDVDDDRAKRINLVDNRTNDIADYDYEALYEQILSLPTLEGTGYADDLMDQILEQAGTEATNYGNIGVGNVSSSVFDADEDPVDVDSFDDLPDHLRGVADLKPDVIFESNDWWGMPDLMPSMLMPKITETVDTWSGPSSSKDDGTSLFLYSYATDSTKGMPWERTIINFWTSDSRFESWWAEPNKYIARMLNAKIYGAVSHDFSVLPGLPRLLQHFNIYRSRWLARYMQESGIKIIPHIQCVDLSSFDFCLDGIPVNPPVIADQMQTLTGVNDSPDERKLRQLCLRKAVEELEPEQLLLYGTQQGFDIVNEMNLPCEVIYVESRAVRRTKWRKQRDQAVYGTATLRRKSSRVSGVPQSGVTNQQKN